MKVQIESHYAPEKIECPRCEVTGEMTFSDGLGFYCCSCGTNYESEELPTTVEI